MRIRARYLVPLLCGLAIVPLGLWHSSRQTAAERLVRWEQRAEIEESTDELNKFVDVPAGEMSLGDLQELIEKSTDLEVEFDEALPQWLTANSKDPTVAAWKVELPEGLFRLRTLLAVALNQHDLTYDLAEDRRLVITAQAISSDSRHRYVETYPLPQPELASSATDEHSWAELLMSATDYSNWSEVGGPGHIEAVPGALVISQTARKHREIRRLMAEFMKLESPPADYAPVPLWPDSDAEAHARIFAALNEPASIDWVDRPLDEGLVALMAAHQIPCIINVRKLKEAAIPRDLPITKRLSDISLQSLLRLMLSELELTYMFEDGALVITTPDHASAGGLMLVAYPVHDLVGQGPQRDYDPLIELITTVVQPYSWDEVGGPSSLNGGTIDGWLLVSQTLEGYEGIEFLLSQLRKALRHDSPTGVFLVRKENPREQAIWKVLERELELQYDEMPLKDAVSLLSDVLGIPIVANSKKLEEAAITIDTPVRLRFPKRPARQQLNSLLSELELTWLVDDEVVQVTTPDDANSPDRLSTRLYDLRLLTDPDLGVASADKLLEVVQEMIAPQTWDDVGGPASLDWFQDIVVVRQEEHVHAMVERFLSALERHCSRLPRESGQREWLVDPLANPKDKLIEYALLEPIDFSADRIEILQALERLAWDHNLPLIVCHQQLRNSDIEIRTEVRLRAKEMTIAGVLDRLLEPFDATYLVRDGALLITSSYDASTSLRPRLYALPEVYQRSQTLESTFPFNHLKALPAVTWTHDVGTSVVLNDEWAALSGGQPLHRWIEAKLSPGGRWARWAAERKALDEEREATTTWAGIPLNYPVTAAQRYSAPAALLENAPTPEDLQ